jgi:hypothetical protein
MAGGSDKGEGNRGPGRIRGTNGAEQGFPGRSFVARHASYLPAPSNRGAHLRYRRARKDMLFGGLADGEGEKGHRRKTKIEQPPCESESTPASARWSRFLWPGPLLIRSHCPTRKHQWHRKVRRRRRSSISATGIPSFVGLRGLQKASSQSITHQSAPLDSESDNALGKVSWSRNRACRSPCSGHILSESDVPALDCHRMGALFCPFSETLEPWPRT